MNEPSISAQSVGDNAPVRVWPSVIGVLASHGLLVTVTEAVPLFPSTAAVIVTGPPDATPVTRPVGETVAMEALLVVQVKTFPVIAMLFWSRATAVSGVVPPFETVVTAGQYRLGEGTLVQVVPDNQSSPVQNATTASAGMLP